MDHDSVDEERYAAERKSRRLQEWIRWVLWFLFSAGGVLLVIGVTLLIRAAT